MTMPDMAITLHRDRVNNHHNRHNRHNRPHTVTQHHDHICPLAATATTVAVVAAVAIAAVANHRIHNRITIAIVIAIAITISTKAAHHPVRMAKMMVTGNMATTIGIEIMTMAMTNTKRMHRGKYYYQLECCMFLLV